MTKQEIDKIGTDLESLFTRMVDMTKSSFKGGLKTGSRLALMQSLRQARDHIDDTVETLDILGNQMRSDELRAKALAEK